jgi:hypothetical protein
MAICHCVDALPEYLFGKIRLYVPRKVSGNVSKMRKRQRFRSEGNSL